MSWNRSDSNSLKQKTAPGKNLTSRIIAAFFGFSFIVGVIVILLKIQREDFPANQNIAQTHRLADRATVKGSSHFRTNKVFRSAKLAQAAIAKPDIKNENLVVKPHTLGRVIKWKQQTKPTFTNTFVCMISELIKAEPGDRFLNLDIGEEIDDAYEESLKQKIEILPTDSDDVAELKRATIEAQEEVRRCVAEGQKASDIVRSARDDMNKIADYRDAVQKAFNENLIKETNVKTILKLAKEANALMDEYGALHIDAPEDEESAYQMMVDAKEDRLAILDTEIDKESHENE